MTTPFDPDRKRIIKAVVSLVETGSVHSNYGAVTVLDDGAGITYGAHQSTDGGESSLDRIVQLYVDIKGVYAEDLRPYLARLRADATTSSTPGAIKPWVADLMAILALAGDDPIMGAAQEAIFEDHYWKPAAEQATAMGLVLPLSWLVCYDSTIHSGRGGIARIRRRFKELPPSKGGDERAWTRAYIRERGAYLAEIGLGWTSYRVDVLRALDEAGNWGLVTPFEVARPRATIV